MRTKILYGILVGILLTLTGCEQQEVEHNYSKRRDLSAVYASAYGPLLRKQDQIVGRYLMTDLHLFPVQTNEAIFSGTDSTTLEEIKNNPALCDMAPIVLSSPIATKCDPTPTCDSKNCRLEWNADETNRNGVIIIAEWQGGTVGDNPVDGYIVNSKVVKDNGAAVLDHHLFDYMPDYALVNIWVMRARYVGTIANGSVALLPIVIRK